MRPDTDPHALCAAMTRAVEAARWSMNEPDDAVRKAKAMEAVDEVRREMGGKPLTAAMDNVLAWRLGEVARATMSPDQSVGDPIDRGLILRSLLEARGFGLILLPPPPGG